MAYSGTHGSRCVVSRLVSIAHSTQRSHSLQRSTMGRRFRHTCLRTVACRYGNRYELSQLVRHPFIVFIPYNVGNFWFREM